MKQTRQKVVAVRAKLGGETVEVSGISRSSSGTRFRSGVVTVVLGGIRGKERQATLHEAVTMLLERD